MKNTQIAPSRVPRRIRKPMLQAASIICFSITQTVTAQNDYLDTSLSFEQRVDDLVQKMTLEEKILTVSHSRKRLDRLDIGYQICGEALHGYVGPVRQPATVFPQCIGLGATWNPPLVKQIGNVISDEIRAMYHHGTAENWGKKAPLFLMAPDINIARDPRWGRTQETYSEDPFMLSQFAAAYVQGMQGEHEKYLKVVCAPKHFVANNEEHNRFSADPQISEKDLREYYLPAFKAAVTEGKSRSIMTAYNALNGVPCVANSWLQNDVLKGDWGFTGFTLPDFGSPLWMIEGESWAAHKGHGYAKNKVESAWLCMNAGLDYDVFSPVYENHLKEAIELEKVSMERVDDAVRRCLLARFELGEFDPDEMVPFTKIPFSVVASEPHKELSMEAARQSMVLLQNRANKEGKKLLPLDASQLKKVAIIGPNADKVNYGNYSGFSKTPVTALNGLRNYLQKHDVSVDFVKWDKKVTAEPILQEFISLLGPDGVPSWRSQVFANENYSGKPQLEYWEKSMDISWNKDFGPRTEIKSPQYSAIWTTTLMPPKAGQYLIELTYTGGLTVDLDGQRVMSDWYLNAKERKQIVPVALEANKATEIVVKFKSDQINDRVKIAWVLPGEQSSDAGSELEAAQSADAVIAIMGMTTAFEGEGKDRSAPGLPDDQINVLKEVLAANPNTIVVLENGSSVESQWLADNAPAILEAWYPGERGGDAIAETIFGDNNPAGCLPITFAKSWNDLPAFDDYKVSNGRTYMHFKHEPLFAFGHGLSYTEFKLDNFDLAKDLYDKNSNILVSFDVTNTGNRIGDKVVQLYVRDNLSENNPKRRLKAFSRVAKIKPGETRPVTLEFNSSELAYWNDSAKQFEVSSGEYLLELAESSAKIVNTKPIKIK
ncbi:beta-glucosidase [Persicirhabdus sediminis]|uniref:Glycoside hydrolase family 3 C-terminal domain-containing protein n=1 Tax=Persicirhabdus sediminis TaxID=454144 RepID=A0A8J7MG88_9BACT|nr:glycoside hydrolase family 3 C-terminal domain-containing protein [Persicirhabdus sediminis]MBK1792477.1 glycoside hydrolase family 3 C-terminal domain-containing protein [Persicirhabdus sediminis]